MAQEETSVAITNRFLLALPAASRERLCAHLEPIELTPRQPIHHVGAPVDYLYFVHRGLISLVKSMRDGRTVEVGAIGIDGFAGLFAAHGVPRATWEAVVQAPGWAHRIKPAVFRQEMANDEALRRQVRSYTYVAVAELAQNAGCNRLHSLEERCCRWLLIAHDSAGADAFPLTHEFLALMLGVQRSGLSLTASVLQKAGLIRYTRGRVTITDRAGLEASACECYRTVRTEFDSLFGLPRGT